MDQPLFLTLVGRAVTRTRLLQLLNSLRNGGNAYELQMLLGHSTLEMVRTYLSLADADLEHAHKRASPVEKWRL